MATDAENLNKLNREIENVEHLLDNLILAPRDRDLVRRLLLELVLKRNRPTIEDRIQGLEGF
jgi:hypothetical protein